MTGGALWQTVAAHYRANGAAAAPKRLSPRARAHVRRGQRVLRHSSPRRCRKRRRRPRAPLAHTFRPFEAPRGSGLASAGRSPCTPSTARSRIASVPGSGAQRRGALRLRRGREARGAPPPAPGFLPPGPATGLASAQAPLVYLALRSDRSAGAACSAAPRPPPPRIAAGNNPPRIAAGNASLLPSGRCSTTLRPCAPERSSTYFPTTW
jgi:hypothetical protein